MDAGVDGGHEVVTGRSGGDLGRQPERAEQDLSDLDLIPKAYNARVATRRLTAKVGSFWPKAWVSVVMI